MGHASYRTLNEALIAKRESRRGVTFFEGAESEQRLVYARLYERAAGLLFHLQKRGLRPGDELIVCVSDNARFVEAFWACLLGGIVAVPVAPGVSDEHRHKLFRIFDKLARAYLYTDPKTLDRLATFGASADLRQIFARVSSRTVASEPASELSRHGELYDPDPDDTAFIQFSSGSTSEPKGVVLTHRNIMTNIRAISAGGAFSDQDVSLSWMPLTHDMGLIGFHLSVLVWGIEQYLMPTELFVRRPLLWLQAASDKRASLLCSPNFGYQHFLKAFEARGAEGLDLASVRLIFNGAEPISLGLCETFLERMARFGLARTAMFPVYGLAEASLAVSFPAPGGGYRALHVDRNRLGVGDRVRLLAPEDADAASFLALGTPLKDCRVRVVGDDEREVAAHTVGHIQLQGANVTVGYYRDEAENRASFTDDGWLDTGDLGLMSEGELVVTGRSKDIIFVNGQNYYPHDLEAVAEGIEPLELGRVVAAGYRDHRARADELLVFVVFRGELAELMPIARELRRVLNEHTGVEVAHVIPVKRVPKTTSGKAQRHVLTRAYAQGGYAEVLERMAALDAPQGEVSAAERTEIEARLKGICDAALGDRRIGVHESLFEVGASSLALVQIHERVEEAFPGLIEITDLFDYPTVAELAAQIEAKLDQGNSRGLG